MLKTDYKLKSISLEYMTTKEIKSEVWEIFEAYGEKISNMPSNVLDRMLKLEKEYEFRKWTEFKPKETV